MPDYPYSRDGEAGVLRGGRERRGARGPGPQQPESASSGDVGRRDRRTGGHPESRVRLAAQRPLLPALQGMLLRAPLRSRSASARPVSRLHVRLPCVSAHMVRRAVPARVEDHVRGYAEFLGGVYAGDRTAGHGGLGLPLLQHPHIQSEAAGRPSPEGGPADRVTRRRSQRRLRRTAPLASPRPPRRRVRVRERLSAAARFPHPSEHEHAAMRSRKPVYMSVVLQRLYNIVVNSGRERRGYL